MLLLGHARARAGHPAHLLLVAGAALAALATPALPVRAHDGLPPAPHDLWHAWTGEPIIMLALLLAAGVYARGLHTLWRRAGRGRGIPAWRATSYSLGLVMLFIALLSPLDALGSALFAAHMAQHLVVLVAAPPLLLLGLPLVAAVWALPLAGRHRLARWWRCAGLVRHGWRVLTQPVLAGLLSLGVLGLWHAPSLYQAALGSRAVHGAEHASMLGAAFLFWWTIVQPGGAGMGGYGGRVLAVFGTALAGGLLGALITFAPSPWYPIYRPFVAAWGLTPLDDQQLAGLIMWGPAGLVYAATALALVAAWLRQAERAARRRASRDADQSLPG
jgi:putative membrane protein